MKPSMRAEYKNEPPRYSLTRTYPEDPRATAELVRLALAADEEAAWEYIGILWRRGTPDVLEAGRQLCRSAYAEERALGAEILGQLDLKDEAEHAAAVTALLDLLAQEDDSHVLYSAAVALGHRDDRQAIPALVQLKDYPDQDVRYGVVQGLLRHEDDQAIAALIALSDDPATRVRDWATFGLGSLIEANTPAIRDALYARIDDWNEEVRGEAFCGLARCADPRLVVPLLRELEGDEIGSLFIDAAIEAGVQLRDPRLHPALVRLQAFVSGYDSENLEEAMKLCWNQKP